MDQLLSAISIVSDPTQNRPLQEQAINYLNSIRQSPADSWQLALNLFVDSKPDGSRAYDPQIRSFALQILDDLFNERVQPLDLSTFETIKSAFVSYIYQEYRLGAAESNASFIRNKFSHTLALFFLCSYPDQWPDFFQFVYQLLPSTSSSPSSTAFNLQASALFFRLLIEISSEVADSIIKAARTFAEDRHQRDGNVRDQIRDRDSKGISDAVLAIISDSEAHLIAARNGGEPIKQSLEEIIGLAVRAFASLIPWINVNFTVTPNTLPLLFRLLSDPALQIRLETANSFLRMIQKGLKEPTDKLQLIRVLSLGEVLVRLEGNTRGDDENMAFREGLGKLLNGLGLELCKLVDESALAEELRVEARHLLQQLFTVALRFLADEWDDTSVTVHLFLSTVLGSYKRYKKVFPQTHMTPDKKQFLSSLLEVVLDKMKWEKDADPENMDDDEKVAFETMRKDLRSFLESIIVLDEELVNSYARTVVLNTLQLYQRGNNVPWQDLELAIYLVYLYGELQKGAKGPTAFVQVPLEIKAELKRAVPTGRKPKMNYAEYPLNAHGELMMTLVQSNVVSHPHANVAMQFFETVGRYGDFFRTRRECNDPVLAAFLDTRGMHNSRTDLRGRLFYLFHRFIKDIRSEIPPKAIPSILDNISDLLVLNVELPEPDSATLDILEAAVNSPSLFDSQIYLFETIGTLISLLDSAQTEQAARLQDVTSPLLNALQTELQVQMLGPQDVLPVLKVHHLIRALGNISKGFPDAPIPTPDNYSSPVWVPVFDAVANAVMVSMNSMHEWKIVREATRFAFARIIAAAGPATTKYIPNLMSAMFTSCQPSELVEFIGFLGLVVHKLQMEIYPVLEDLIKPLHEYMAILISRTIDGTDAKQVNEQSKKAYLELLVNIMTGRLYIIFVSERNKTLVEPLCQFVLTIAGDTTDPPSQRVAWTLLARFTTHFGRTEQAQAEFAAKEAAEGAAHMQELYTIPGYERFIYDALIPLAFELPNQSTFNLKDGQTLGVLGEIGVLLAATRKARGSEVINFFANVFLPSQSWPPQAITNFVTALQAEDTRGFKKYWQDFVRSSSTSSK